MHTCHIELTSDDVASLQTNEQLRTMLNVLNVCDETSGTVETTPPPTLSERHSIRKSGALLTESAARGSEVCRGNICFESSQDMIPFKELFDEAALSILACDVALLRAKSFTALKQACVCVCVWGGMIHHAHVCVHCSNFYQH